MQYRNEKGLKRCKKHWGRTGVEVSVKSLEVLKHSDFKRSKRVLNLNYQNYQSKDILDEIGQKQLLKVR